MDIGGIRIPYKTRANAFLEDSIAVKDPIKLFDQWFQEARNTPELIEPNAMCLSTATRDGIPSARFVLCKGYGEDGFQFYTHYTSRKGRELEENPNVALTFYWNALNRSVRIEGTASKLPMSFADDYFKSRPHASQIGALCSDQSELVESRDKLVEFADELRNKYESGEVPKPPHWGGYTVVPKSIEFWQGQNDRIHDRIKFRQAHNDEIPDSLLTHKGVGNWIYERLQP
uniref:pyridoxal 5'-phosphate synthase n=1 Tax=Photinus pyralis TaxID=7054 RepID=A0A1Y1M739_PHOPY